MANDKTECPLCGADVPAKWIVQVELKYVLSSEKSGTPPFQKRPFRAFMSECCTEIFVAEDPVDFKYVNEDDLDEALGPRTLTLAGGGS